EMERILEEQSKEIAEGRTGLVQDAAFHAAIGVAAHNGAITRIAHAVMDLLTQSREESLNTPGRRQRSHQDHRRILIAIRERNEQGARGVRGPRVERPVALAFSGEASCGREARKLEKD